MAEDRTKIALSELFKRQESAGDKATVERIPDREGFVKVTPWKKNVGCLCSSALTVREDTIEAVEMTDEMHECCGKTLFVVRVQFKPDAVLKVSELFNEKQHDLAAAQTIHQHIRQQGSWPTNAPGAMQMSSGASYPHLSEVGYGDIAQASWENPPGSESSFSDCPTGMYRIQCAGGFYCVPIGSTCCAGVSICYPGTFCLQCAGFSCQPRGSFCCAGRPCGPGRRCIQTPRGFECV